MRSQAMPLSTSIGGVSSVQWLGIIKVMLPLPAGVQ
ncbi:unnamed protein product [Rhodiola kirilowii]